MIELYVYHYSIYRGLEKEKVEVLKETEKTLKLTHNLTFCSRILKSDLDKVIKDGSSFNFYMTTEDDAFVKAQIVKVLYEKIDRYRTEIQKYHDKIAELLESESEHDSN